MKTLSPSAVIALKDALINIYWKKQDLKNFVKLSIKNTSIVDTISWEGNKKFESVNELVDRMIQRKDIYHNDLLKLIHDVIDMEDFSHLKIWEDSDIKIKRAQESVNNLRSLAKGFFESYKESEEIKTRSKNVQEKKKEEKKIEEQVNSLKEKFQILSAETNPHKRGRELETFLNELFYLFDLAPRKSFVLSDHQIDGAFTFENDDYLLEAKWHGEAIEAGDIRKFAAVIEEKLKNTLGLFISINGFTKGSKELSGASAKSIILMDGNDLYAVLGGYIDLGVLLFRKRRYASETGVIYFPINEILKDINPA
jgi:hypothetical protein